MSIYCMWWYISLCSRECAGSDSSSYVNGYNLSNFLHLVVLEVVTPTWLKLLPQFERCCFSPGRMGGDFGMGTHAASCWSRWLGLSLLYNNDAMLQVTFIGTLGVSYGVRQCWIRCGCWTVPYGHGGQGGITSYCGSGIVDKDKVEDSLRSLTSKPNRKFFKRGL